MNPPSVKENLEKIFSKISKICHKVGRDESEIKIVAVTKGQSPERILEAVECGIVRIGENRIQEALEKIPLLPHQGLEFHFVGQLQTNKVKQMLLHFHYLHSLDRIKLVEAIHAQALKLNIESRLPVLIQVNLTGKETQGGVDEQRLVPLIERAARYPELDVRGLMTIGPYPVDERETRRVFRKLWELKEEINTLKIPGVYLCELSMGMSEDFEIAIEEGATMIRLGRAIFGERSTLK
ncbi:YggS family pyridoxal phosphate-dependent enzyme [Atrimonas thermophila]|uniref:YggS family pyridoxal phosphate-dependent enzyme n=1 Tax=Atrimonas thermophila TaxID=3064161 RepID=UPI00399C5241